MEGEVAGRWVRSFAACSRFCGVRDLFVLRRGRHFEPMKDGQVIVSYYGQDADAEQARAWRRKERGGIGGSKTRLPLTAAGASSRVALRGARTTLPESSVPSQPQP